LDTRAGSATVARARRRLEDAERAEDVDAGARLAVGDGPRLEIQARVDGRAVELALEAGDRGDRLLAVEAQRQRAVPGQGGDVAGARARELAVVDHDAQLAPAQGLGQGASLDLDLAVEDGGHHGIRRRGCRDLRGARGGGGRRGHRRLVAQQPVRAAQDGAGDQETSGQAEVDRATIGLPGPRPARGMRRRGGQASADAADGEEVGGLGVTTSGQGDPGHVCQYGCYGSARSSCTTNPRDGWSSGVGAAVRVPTTAPGVSASTRAAV
jgi:hypothetical protein